MKKGSIKLLVAIALVAMLALSWYTLFDDVAKLQNEYTGYLSTAREKIDKELYDDGIDYYNYALEMSDTMELREEIADMYMFINRIGQYLEFCEQTITKYPKDERAYVRLAEYYNQTEDYAQCYTIIGRAEKRGVNSSRLTELSDEMRYYYKYEYIGYDEIGIFSNGLCTAKNGDGRWGFVNSNGGTYIGFSYTDVAEYTGNYFTVRTASGEYMLIDSTGRAKSRDSEKRQIDDCLSLCEDKMSVKYNGKYHYCDFEFNELFGSYDYAGSFNEGFAAVMDGGRWYIIDSEGSQVGGTFEEICVDEIGIAFRGGVAFAKENGRYFLVDTSGERVGDNTWAMVDCFNSDQPAAVSNGSRWGFVNTSGEMVVDYTYGGARSFSNGFAAVAVQDQWGYIVNDGFSLEIEHQFADAGDFSSNGTAFVKQTNGWDLIKLYSYNR